MDLIVLIALSVSHLPAVTSLLRSNFFYAGETGRLAPENTVKN
jgi:hypothetical protein